MVSIYATTYSLFKGKPRNGPAHHPVLGTGLHTVKMAAELQEK